MVLDDIHRRTFGEEKHRDSSRISSPDFPSLIAVRVAGDDRHQSLAGCDVGIGDTLGDLVLSPAACTNPTSASRPSMSETTSWSSRSLDARDR